MLYHVYELSRATLAPMRLFATGALTLLDNPFNPFRPTPMGRLTVAALDSFEHTTRRFGKPVRGSCMARLRACCSAAMRFCVS